MTNIKTPHEYPAEILKLWSDRNTVPISEFFPGSNKKQWWVCDSGHEWEAVFNKIISGQRCPYCSGHRVGYGNSLEDQVPELMGEWDFEKNDVQPDKITSGSKKVVWWKCNLGHGWSAAVYSRAGEKRTGCPYCSGRLAASGETLADLHPELLAEWDFSKNSADPYKTHPGSTQKVWWTCKNGHEFQTRVRIRAIDGSKCPTCNSLGFLYPDLAKQWHTEKNDKSPFDYTEMSGQTVWWKCEVGHEWAATIGSRHRHGCPYCSGQLASPGNNFAQSFPDQARHWDLVKNSVSPGEVTPGTAKKYHFTCENGHDFSVSPNNVGNGHWCPYCSNQKVGYGNSLLDTNPDLATEWNYVKNTKSPDQVLPGSNRKAWWKCSLGHEWQASIGSRVAGNSCPYCANRLVGYGNSLQELFPDIAAEIDQEKSPVDPSKLVAGTAQQIWWKCKRGHSWQAPVVRRTGTGAGCRFCSSQTSIPEIRILTEIMVIFPDAIARDKSFGAEVDVYIPSLKVGIEYDGSYYHSKKVEADKKKKELLEKNGLRLIRVREEPLECGERDINVGVGHETISHQTIVDVLESIKKSGLDIGSNLESYKKHNGFVAEQEFKRVLSYLPGPPLEDSLASINPELCEEWNYARNAPLVPELFHPASGKKVWWVCEKGHEWQATINKRNAGRNCPYCTNKKVGYGNSLAEMYPEIAAQWYEKGNGELKPTQFVPGSGQRVWWKCENGHIFKVRIGDRVKKQSGCKFCPGRGKNHVYVEPDFD